MDNIIITGASGFIGKNILNFYKDKKIIVVTRRKKIKNSKFVKVINYKNFDELILKLKKIKARIVIHCATHCVKKHKLDDIKNINEANILLGNIILEMSKNIGIKKFINFTSIWELQNKNLYSYSKKFFSELIEFYKRKYIQMKFYNIYLSDTFGKGDSRKKILPTIKRKYKGNQVIKIVSKNLKLNFLNIEDLLNSINILIKKNKIKPGNYLMMNNKNFLIHKIFMQFNSINKKKIKFKYKSKESINTKIPNIRLLPGLKLDNSKISNIVEYIRR